MILFSDLGTLPSTDRTFRVSVLTSTFTSDSIERASIINDQAQAENRQEKVDQNYRGSVE
jgi:hypothetical protein